MIKYVFYTVIQLLFTALAMILTPVIALFTQSDGNLPAYLKWFQTFDATVDEGWKNGYFGTFLTPPTGFKLYWFRMLWLWRNPAYGFCYYLLGENFDPENWVITKWVKTDTVSYFIAKSKDGKLFNVSYGGPKGSYKLGWKAWNYFQGIDQDGKAIWSKTPWGPEMRVPVCFTVNPLALLKLL